MAIYRKFTYEFFLSDVYFLYDKNYKNAKLGEFDWLKEDNILLEAVPTYEALCAVCTYFIKALEGNMAIPNFSCFAYVKDFRTKVIHDTTVALIYLR